MTQLPRTTNDLITSDSTIDDIESATPDFPRRPGLRKLTREPPAPPVPVPPPTENVSARRHNAGKLPAKYGNLDHTVDIEKQFQEYIYTAADNLTITQAKHKHPTEHKKSLHSELTQFHAGGGAEGGEAEGG